MRALRVAFVFSGGAGHWTGGFNYLRNALALLHRHAAGRIRPVLFLAPEVNPEDAAVLAAELADAPIRAPWLAAAARAWRFRASMVPGVDAAALRAFEAARIDVVFEAGEFFGLRFPLPILTWVADFQSHHLPDFFSARARWRTYLGRRLQLFGPRTILLSSRDAERDCLRFYPRSRGRTVVVPFAVPQPEGIVPDLGVPASHGLSARYFYLPNQFWRHKNHVRVIEALAAARVRAPGMTVAASGSPIDHRHPAHYASLQARVAELGLERGFRFLGLVPGGHVPQLALHSTAIVNPSLFEGWSTTVEEGKSLGVPLVLSDIAVHREQAPRNAVFFDAESTESAAAALLEAWEAPVADAASRLEASREDAACRSRAFALELAAALERAASRRVAHA